MEVKYDYLNKPISIGDTVVLIEPGYRNFVKGKVINYTKCFVYVEYANHNNYTKVIKQTSEQLIVFV